jgi:hypothetical protein
MALFDLAPKQPSQADLMRQQLMAEMLMGDPFGIMADAREKRRQQQGLPSTAQQSGLPGAPPSAQPGIFAQANQRWDAFTNKLSSLFGGGQ